jgi:F-type H+-transporting ATPase subunit epsilon
MATFPARLITPERVLLDEEVQAVMLRTDDGDATFLPGHTPLIGAVVPGLLRFTAEDGSEKRFETDRGLVRVEPEGVAVLVPEASAAD